MTQQGEPPSVQSPKDFVRVDGLDLALFGAYLAFYGGYIVLSVAAKEWMAAPAFAGVNRAVAYGFGLIVGAMALAFLSLVLHRPSDRNAH